MIPSSLRALLLASLLLAAPAFALLPGLPGLPATWKELGLEDLDGLVWIRQTLPLEEEARLAAAKDDLGLLLGSPRTGGYEVYAGGRLLGRSRGWSSSLPFAIPEVFQVPRDAIGKGGTVSLALRVR